MPTKRKKYNSKRKGINLKSDQREAFLPEAELDYHKFGILLEYDIEKILYDFLEECKAFERKKALIITGKGRVVRPVVYKLLRKHKDIESFKQAGYFNGQSGAFEVKLAFNK